MNGLVDLATVVLKVLLACRVTGAVIVVALILAYVGLLISDHLQLRRDAKRHGSAHTR